MGVRLAPLTLAVWILCLSAPALGATLSFAGSVDASDLSRRDLLFKLPISLTRIYAYNELGDGSLVVTEAEGFASLEGVTTSDLGASFGGLVRPSAPTPSGFLRPVFAPDGCFPGQSSQHSNCNSVSVDYEAKSDGSSFFDLTLGSTPITTGEILSIQTTIQTVDFSREFGTGIALGTLQLTGGSGAFFDEVLTLTDGTGLATITLDSFDAVCTPRLDPCPFSITGTLTFIPEPSTGLLIALGLCGITRREGGA